MNADRHHSLTAWSTLSLLTTCLVLAASSVRVGLAQRGTAQVDIVVAPPPEGDSASPDENLRFDVASIRPYESNDGRIMMRIQPGGRVTATGVTLTLLLRNAYELPMGGLRGGRGDAIIGGPDWIDEDRFDIEATAGSVAQFTPDMLRPMWRNLLADRFQLQAHLETRETDIYELVLAREDGQLGPRLEPAAVDCEAQRAGLRGRRGGPPALPPPPGPGERIDCGMRFGGGAISAGGMTMEQLADMLPQVAQRQVLDKTGLDGTWDFDLEFSQPQAPQFGAPDAAAPAGDTRPTIFTALQEQLGLKLESTRGPVDVLIIDSVERPTPD